MSPPIGHATPGRPNKLTQGGWRKALANQDRWQFERQILPIVRAVMANSIGNFRLLVTMDVEGKALPLLMVGKIDPKFQDCQVTVVLNPDPSLLSDGVDPIAGVDYKVPPKSATDKADLWCDLLVTATTRARAHTPAYSVNPAKKARFEIK